MTRTTIGGPTMTQKAWFDGWGHLVETQTPGPNLFSKVPAIPSVLITYTIYDKMGNVTTKSLPYAVAATAGLGYVSPDLNQARTVTTADSLGRSLGSVTYSNVTTIVQSSTITYTVAQGVPSFTSDTTTPFERMATFDAYNHQKIVFDTAFGQHRYEQAYSSTGTSNYSVLRTVQYTRDPVGNITAVSTFDNQSTQQASYTATFDGLKQLTGWNDADSGSCTSTPLPPGCSNSADTAWKVTYDADGNQLSQSDPRGQST